MALLCLERRGDGEVTFSSAGKGLGLVWCCEVKLSSGTV
jgi:hypothetical protein